MTAETIHQRARGELLVSVKPSGPETALDDLRQAGCLRARFPRRVVPGWMDVVTLNTSGGIAGGDRLESAFSAASGTRATIAAQAAERFYRRIPGTGPSVVRTGITVSGDAAVEWLPQETILFDGCGLDRQLNVIVAGTACFLGIETLVFGRSAMGETVREAFVRDTIRVRRDGSLVLHDAIRMDGPVEALLGRAAVAAGGHALATLIYVAQDAEARLDRIRGTLRGECAASAWNGMLVVRMLAPDSATLRGQIVAMLPALRGDRPLPRVWMC